MNRLLNRTPLLEAVMEDRVEEAHVLLDAQADPTARDSIGNSVLAYAVLNHRVDLAERLLAAGADVNAQSRTGYTPLIIAAVHDQAEIVRLLLAAGADLARVTVVGKHSALWFAERRKLPQIVELLRTAGAQQ